MITRTVLLALIAMLATAPVILAAADSPFPLVSGGKAAAVVTAAESEHSSRLASKELADYVEKSSGVRPAEVVGLPPEGVPSVLIGTLGKFPGEVPEAAKKAPPASGSGSCCRLRSRRTWTRRSMCTTRCMSTMCP